MGHFYLKKLNNKNGYLYMVSLKKSASYLSKNESFLCYVEKKFGAQKEFVKNSYIF